MKRQIRKGVFETNSSSTHSLTMCLKSDFDKWENGDAWLCQWAWSSDYKDENNVPQRSRLYSKDEILSFMKNHSDCSDIDWNNESEVEDRFEEFIKEDFVSFDDYGDDCLEYYEEEFTTPSGENVVAFGEYGYEG